MLRIDENSGNISPLMELEIKRAAGVDQWPIELTASIELSRPFKNVCGWPHDRFFCARNMCSSNGIVGHPEKRERETRGGIRERRRNYARRLQSSFRNLQHCFRLDSASSFIYLFNKKKLLSSISSTHSFFAWSCCFALFSHHQTSLTTSSPHKSLLRKSSQFLFADRESELAKNDEEIRHKVHELERISMLRNFFFMNFCALTHATKYFLITLRLESWQNLFITAIIIISRSRSFFVSDSFFGPDDSVDVIRNPRSSSDESSPVHSVMMMI